MFEDVDGRLFAVDITNRLINEDDARRQWEDETSRPWKDGLEPSWRSAVWAWRPPTFQARIASQHGAFLLGGVPAAVPLPGRTASLQFRKGPDFHDGKWKIDEARRCTSIALQMHKAEPQAGGVGDEGQPAYTFRIKAEAKQDIRERLTKMFGYDHATTYPDYPGFAQFAIPELKVR